MKTLLFLITDLRGGGAEKALIELLKYIDDKEYKISLCLIFHQGVYLPDIPEKVTVIDIFKKRRSLLYILVRGCEKLFKSTWLLMLLMKLKIHHKYDAIISVEGYPLLLHSFIANKAIKNVSWVHCDLLNYHYTKPCFQKPNMELECYEKMDELIFVSQIALNNFNKLFQVEADKHVLYNIVNVDSILVPSNINVCEKQYFTITAIGSLFPVKAFDRLIRVAKMLKDDGYSFRVQIFGEGSSKAELVRLRDVLKLQDEISFVGFKKAPYSFLKQSDIFVCTSKTEGLPYCICESLVLGVPVVATQTAGSIELLGDNQYGIITKHDDTSIYYGIKSLLDDDDLRLTYKALSVERSKAFSQTDVLDKFYELINKKSR